MTSIEELSKAVGCLEGKTDSLIRNQDRLIETVEQLGKALKRRTLYDSAKIIGAAFSGGFAAVVLKLVIWR
jgi:hypothetical protein